VDPEERSDMQSAMLIDLHLVLSTQYCKCCSILQMVKQSHREVKLLSQADTESYAVGI
jgi:hypothetical protein